MSCQIVSPATQTIIQNCIEQLLNLHDVEYTWLDTNNVDIKNSEGKILKISDICQQIANFINSSRSLAEVVELVKYFCDCKTGNVKIGICPGLRSTLRKIELGNAWFDFGDGVSVIDSEQDLLKHFINDNRLTISRVNGRIIDFKIVRRIYIDSKCLDKLFEIYKNIDFTKFIKDGLEQAYKVKIVDIIIGDNQCIWITDMKEQLMVEADKKEISKKFDKINNIQDLVEIKKTLDQKIQMLEELELEKVRLATQRELEMEKARLAELEKVKPKYTEETLIRTCQAYKKILKTGSELSLLKEDFTKIFGEDYGINSAEHSEALKLLNHVLYEMDSDLRGVLLLSIDNINNDDDDSDDDDDDDDDSDDDY